MSITYWKGQVIERMTDPEAAACKQEMKVWAENYANVTGSVELGKQAIEMYQKFDTLRAESKSQRIGVK